LLSAKSDIAQLKQLSLVRLGAFTFHFLDNQAEAPVVALLKLASFHCSAYAAGEPLDLKEAL
jgi:hypothetical protein